MVIVVSVVLIVVRKVTSEDRLDSKRELEKRMHLLEEEAYLELLKMVKQ